jgi:hypothetical protein
MTSYCVEPFYYMFTNKMQFNQMRTFCIMLIVSLCTHYGDAQCDPACEGSMTECNVEDIFNPYCTCEVGAVQFSDSPLQCYSPAVPCGSSPCLNSGSCVSTGYGTYECLCATNYFGDLCQYDCNMYDCQSGSHCAVTGGNPGCVCDSETAIQSSASPFTCEENRCLNPAECNGADHGECRHSLSGNILRYYCECKWPYHGQDCSWHITSTDSCTSVYTRASIAGDFTINSTLAQMTNVPVMTDSWSFSFKYRLRLSANDLTFSFTRTVFQCTTQFKLQLYRSSSTNSQFRLRVMGASDVAVIDNVISNHSSLFLDTVGTFAKITLTRNATESSLTLATDSDSKTAAYSGVNALSLSNCGAPGVSDIEYADFQGSLFGVNGAQRSGSSSGLFLVNENNWVIGCQNNGNASVYTDARCDVEQCTCPYPYGDNVCDKFINACSSDPCEHSGTCTDNVETGGFSCACTGCYTGTFCENEINACASNPCYHEGVCHPVGCSYSCTCPAGKVGPRCATDINECNSEPCVKGTCINGDNRYDCVCDADYEGARCTKRIDDCASSPCANGGTCVDGELSFTCTCASSFSGDTCDMQTSNAARAYECHIIEATFVVAMLGILYINKI